MNLDELILSALLVCTVHISVGVVPPMQELLFNIREARLIRSSRHLTISFYFASIWTLLPA